MRIPITSYGRHEITIGSSFLLVLAVICACIHPVLTAAPALVWIALISFFRDPERPCTCGPGELLSPADGTVADIEKVGSAPFLDQPCLRVGVFMSVLDVHVNRSPCAGRVTFTEHQPGKYFDARSEECKKQNEHNYVGITTGDGKKVLVNQIAGLIARRIVCAVKPGEELGCGDRFGMIKFGSRVELYVPLAHEPEAAVKIGQKVAGGRDVLILCRPSSDGS